MLYSKIFNPYTNRMVNVNSRTGKYILQGYINQLNGGSGKSNWKIVQNKLDILLDNNSKSLSLLKPNYKGKITKTNISELLKLLRNIKKNNTLDEVSNSNLQKMFPGYTITNNDIQKGLEILIKKIVVFLLNQKGGSSSNPMNFDIPKKSWSSWLWEDVAGFAPRDEEAMSFMKQEAKEYADKVEDEFSYRGLPVFDKNTSWVEGSLGIPPWPKNKGKLAQLLWILNAQKVIGLVPSEGPRTGSSETPEQAEMNRLLLGVQAGEFGAPEPDNQSKAIPMPPVPDKVTSMSRALKTKPVTRPVTNLMNHRKLRMKTDDSDANLGKKIKVVDVEHAKIQKGPHKGKTGKDGQPMKQVVKGQFPSSTLTTNDGDEVMVEDVCMDPNFCQGNLGIPRSEMPQIDQHALAKNVFKRLQDKGQIDGATIDEDFNFRNEDGTPGISSKNPSLRPIQEQIFLDNTNNLCKAGIVDHKDTRPLHDNTQAVPFEPTKKFKDSMEGSPVILAKGRSPNSPVYIVDGHHRASAEAFCSTDEGIGPALIVTLPVENANPESMHTFLDNLHSVQDDFNSEHREFMNKYQESVSDGTDYLYNQNVHDAVSSGRGPHNIWKSKGAVGKSSPPNPSPSPGPLPLLSASDLPNLVTPEDRGIL